MGKWLLSAISVVITSHIVCPPGGGEGSVQADEAGHVPDPGIQHRQHTLVRVAASDTAQQNRLLLIEVSLL